MNMEEPSDMILPPGRSGSDSTICSGSMPLLSWLSAHGASWA
jgi:hypothetical protein